MRRTREEKKEMIGIEGRHRKHEEEQQRKEGIINRPDPSTVLLSLPSPHSSSRPDRLRVLGRPAYIFSLNTRRKKEKTHTSGSARNVFPSYQSVP